MKRIFICLFPLHLIAFKLGIENLSGDLVDRFAQARIGIVTNQTGVDSAKRRSVDLLLKKKLNVCAIFVPEHGLGGVIGAAQTVTNDIDSTTGLPIISLYKQGSGHIARNAFDEVDVVFFDMQDVGMRHYTYISTLYTVMEALARDKKSIVVCDRPNLLGSVMEGPICDDALRSFIGIAPVPLRHGMTIGELALLFNSRCLKEKVDLSVVPLGNYQRDMKLYALPTHLSPNIQTLSSVHGYSFLGLLGEVKPFNVGVGTPYAFQVITLPQEHDVSLRSWDALQSSLADLNISCKRYCYHHKKRNKLFNGVAVAFKDINKACSFKALLTVLTWARKQGIPVAFSSSFDKAVGTKEVRDWYATGQDQKVLVDKVKKELYDFLNCNKDFLLYQSVPRVVRKMVKDYSFILA